MVDFLLFGSLIQDEKKNLLLSLKDNYLPVILYLGAAHYVNRVCLMYKLAAP